jgi:hypothetical protein
MKNAKRLGSRWIFLPFAGFAALFLVAPAGAQLTGPGNNAVYNSSAGWPSLSHLYLRVPHPYSRSLRIGWVRSRHSQVGTGSFTPPLSS